MAAPAFETTPTVVPLYKLLKEVYAGQLLIPRFQRPFVWTDEQRVELLESIVGGIPIGSILVWRTIKRLGDLETYPPPMEVEFRGVERRQYLLDGHQRVITLLTALSSKIGEGEDAAFSWAQEIERNTRMREIYYDLEGQSFEIHRESQEIPGTWLPLRIVFDDYALFEFTGALVTSRGPEARVLVNRARNLNRTFADFPIVMIPVATDDIQIAIRSFERANATGTPMSEAHMVSALTWSKEFDLNAKLREIINDLSPDWQSLDETAVLTLCKALLDLNLSTRDVDNLKQQLQSNPSIFTRARETLGNAIKFLEEECNVFGTRTLPYTHQLILLADVLTRFDATFSDPNLVTWFWQTSYFEYFSGITPARLENALSHLRWNEDRSRAPGLAPWSVPRVQHFDLRTPRCRTLALRLAAMSPDPRASARLLARYGEAAIPKLFPPEPWLSKLGPGTVEGVQNRFVADPQEIASTRKRILEARADDLEFLMGHGIDLAAADHLRRKQIVEFFMTRSHFIYSSETEFIKAQIGLEYAP